MIINIDKKVCIHIWDEKDNNMSVDEMERISAGVRAFARAYEGAAAMAKNIPVEISPSVKRKAKGVVFDYKPYLEGKPFRTFITEQFAAKDMTRKDMVALVLSKGVPSEKSTSISSNIDTTLKRDPGLKEKVYLYERSKKLDEANKEAEEVSE